MSEYSNGKPQGAGRNSGFTVVEILAVMAVITVLAGLVFGIAGIASQKAADAACISELEQWRNLLEDYKAEEGDYPQANSLVALSSITGSFRTFYDAAEREFDFKDPWGQNYLYQRKSRFRYLIGSKGPDQKYGEDVVVEVGAGNVADFGKFDDITNENGRLN